MPEQPYLLEARGLTKRFGAQEVLAGVNLAVPAGSVVCVLGKSGTGMSVFL
jgi:ABC-type transporter Mla maintaining outer membrane lipid asymmetry ATPase subunit MlaF